MRCPAITASTNILTPWIAAAGIGEDKKEHPVSRGARDGISTPTGTRLTVQRRETT
jgi:hypothetical protein